MYYSHTQELAVVSAMVLVGIAAAYFIRHKLDDLPVDRGEKTAAKGLTYLVLYAITVAMSLELVRAHLFVWESIKLKMGAD